MEISASTRRQYTPGGQVPARGNHRLSLSTLAVLMLQDELPVTAVRHRPASARRNLSRGGILPIVPSVAPGPRDCSAVCPRTHDICESVCNPRPFWYLRLWSSAPSAAACGSTSPPRGSLLERSDGQYAARTAASLGGLVRADIESGRGEGVGRVIEEFTQVVGAALRGRAWTPTARSSPGSATTVSGPCGTDGCCPCRSASPAPTAGPTCWWWPSRCSSGGRAIPPGGWSGRSGWCWTPRRPPPSWPRPSGACSIVAVAVTACAIPLGYLLVWRVVLQPIGRLAAVTRQLAGGDLSARTGMCRNDEMGDLASAFDTMAEHVAQARRQLLRANEHLERKVAQRTRRTGRGQPPPDPGGHRQGGVPPGRQPRPQRPAAEHRRHGLDDPAEGRRPPARRGPPAPGAHPRQRRRPDGA